MAAQIAMQKIEMEIKLKFNIDKQTLLLKLKNKKLKQL